MIGKLVLNNRSHMTNISITGLDCAGVVSGAVDGRLVDGVRVLQVLSQQERQDGRRGRLRHHQGAEGGGLVLRGHAEGVRGLHPQLTEILNGAVAVGQVMQGIRGE